jgi:serine/threonine protein kinase
MNPIFEQYSVNNKYIIVEQIGKGRFGEVYRGNNKNTNEPVAIKRERVLYHPSAQSIRPLNILKHETRILNYLTCKKCRHIPQIYWYGEYCNMPTLVMPLYEYSLYDWYTRRAPHHVQISQTLHCIQTHRAEVQTPPAETANAVHSAGLHHISILQILQSIHDCGIVHRDIKPQNFMVKRGELFLIDFGMATFYVDGQYVHIPDTPSAKEHILGTPKYISYNVHDGREYTRRDDLISAGYMFLFMEGHLFWNTIHMERDIDIGYPETHIMHPKNQALKTAKTMAQIEKGFLDVGSGPGVISRRDRSGIVQHTLLDYLRYVYGLAFSETPNYELLIQQFRRQFMSETA